MLTVLLFGPVSDIAGSTFIEVPWCQSMTVYNVTGYIEEHYPQLHGKFDRVAVNRAIVLSGDFPLNEGDEIALLSRFSGG